MNGTLYNLSFKLAQLSLNVQRYEEKTRFLQEIYTSVSKSASEDDINGIQLYPSKWPRTVFISVKSENAKNKLLVEGLDFDGKHIELQDEHGGPVLKVTILDAPFEMDNEQIQELLKCFGDIIKIEDEYLSFDGRVTSCKTGNRVVHFSAITSEIPVQINAIYHGCPVVLTTWYRQRSTNVTNVVKNKCMKCGSNDHDTRGCPSPERLCFACKKPGHSNAQCRNRQNQPRRVSQKENDTAVCFMGGGSTLSNFCMKFPIEIDGNHYLCNEQYIVREKAMLFNDNETAESVMELSDPTQMYYLGKKVKNFRLKLWKEKRDQIVRKCNFQKYSTHPEAREELLGTGGKMIAEATTDPYWGIGMRITDPDIFNVEKWESDGNAMGHILEDLREEFRIANMIEKAEIDTKQNNESLLIIGDSNCRGVQMENVPFKVVNEAMSGTGISDIESRIHEIGIQSDEVKVIILHVGTCDFDEKGNNNVPLMYAEYVESLNLLGGHFPNAEIIVSSIPPRCPREGIVPNLNDEIGLLNEMLKGLCAKEQCLTYLNNDDGLRLNGGMLDHLMYHVSDKRGVHLNNQGLAVLTDKFRESAIEAYYKFRLEGEYDVVANPTANE